MNGFTITNKWMSVEESSACKWGEREVGQVVEVLRVVEKQGGGREVKVSVLVTLILFL